MHEIKLFTKSSVAIRWKPRLPAGRRGDRPPVRGRQRRPRRLPPATPVHRHPGHAVHLPGPVRRRREGLDPDLPEPDLARRVVQDRPVQGRYLPRRGALARRVLRHRLVHPQPHQARPVRLRHGLQRGTTRKQKSYHHTSF